MERNSFVFYLSFYEALEHLQGESYIRVMKAVMRYAFFGEEPTGLEGPEKMAYILIKPQLDANNRRFENGKKGAEYGKRGGRPRKNKEEKTKNPYGVIDKNPYGVIDKTPNDNVNVNVNVNDNVNDDLSEDDETKLNDKSPSDEGMVEQAQPIINTPHSQQKKMNNTKNYMSIYKDIESYYKNIYTGTFGRAPIINYGRVRKQIKSILNSGATVEQIKDAISKALADDWVMQGGFNIETILSAKTFNRVLNNPYKTDGQKSYSKEPYDEDEEFRRLEADLYTNDPAYKEWQELKRKKASGELDREFEEHRAEWEAFKEKMRSAK